MFQQLNSNVISNLCIWLRIPIINFNRWHHLVWVLSCLKRNASNVSVCSVSIRATIALKEYAQCERGSHEHNTFGVS